MLFTSYRCRSCVQGRRMVHLLNCMLLLKSQMTYWAKVLLIAAGPSAQHPKLLLPPAEKNLTIALKHTGNRLNLQCCHIKRGLSILIWNWQVWKIHLPETHLHKSILPGPTCPCKETGMLPGKALELPSAAHITLGQQEEGCCPEAEHSNKHQSPRPLRSAFCGAPSEKDGTAWFTWE